MKKVACFAILLCFTPIAVKADNPVDVRFEYWGALRRYDLTTVAGRDLNTRRTLYIGWANGFLAAAGLDAYLAPKDQADEILDRSARLLTCLGGLSNEQVVAMIDKYYLAHPEEWSRLLTVEIPAALVGDEGSPCFDVLAAPDSSSVAPDSAPPAPTPQKK